MTMNIIGILRTVAVDGNKYIVECSTEQLDAQNSSRRNLMSEEKKTKVTNEQLFEALVVLDQKLNLILNVFNKIQDKVEKSEATEEVKN